ncbi:hypothetical protein [Bdellovibrio sp.]|uniref:hypothetical protein n=1 Tax=Bdellovibrio sp. TaxID=28201 RepID=UPI0039E6CB30
MKASIFTLLLISLIFSATPAYTQELSDLENSCDTYYDIENSLRCGYQSYIRKFALPYCQEYLRRHDSFSPAGQVVAKGIRACLQQELLANLYENPDLSCNNIQSIGIRSHYKCYIEAGFCELPNPDLVLIMWIAKRQVFNAEIMATFMDVVGYCQRGSP